MIECIPPNTESTAEYTLEGREFSLLAEASEPVEHKFFAGTEEQSFGGGWGTEGKLDIAMQLPRGRALKHTIVNHTDHHVAVSFRIYNGWDSFYRQHGLVRYAHTGCLPLLVLGLVLALCLVFA